MIDRNMEKRVWHRVYGQESPSSSPDGNYPPLNQARLQQCLRRAQENATQLDRYREHPVYGEAIRQIVRQSAQHCQMLRQMLSRHSALGK